jgi:hypothetical protein
LIDSTSVLYIHVPENRDLRRVIVPEFKEICRVVFDIWKVILADPFQFMPATVASLFGPILVNPPLALKAGLITSTIGMLVSSVRQRLSQRDFTETICEYVIRAVGISPRQFRRHHLEVCIHERNNQASIVVTGVGASLDEELHIFDRPTHDNPETPSVWPEASSYLIQFWILDVAAVVLLKLPT